MLHMKNEKQMHKVVNSFQVISLETLCWKTKHRLSKMRVPWNSAGFLLTPKQTWGGDFQHSWSCWTDFQDFQSYIDGKLRRRICHLPIGRSVGKLLNPELLPMYSSECECVNECRFQWCGHDWVNEPSSKKCFKFSGKKSITLWAF